MASNRSVNPLPGLARHRNRPDAMGEAGHARHERVDVGLVLEEVQMVPRAFRRVVNRA